MSFSVPTYSFIKDVHAYNNTNDDIVNIDITVYLYVFPPYQNKLHNEIKHKNFSRKFVREMK